MAYSSVELITFGVVGINNDAPNAGCHSREFDYIKY